MTDNLKEMLNLIRDILNYPIFSAGQHAFTLMSGGKFLVLLLIVVFAVRMLRRYVLRRVLSRTKLDQSLQFAIVKITSYAFTLLGLYIVFQIIGIDLSSLAVIAGAIGVGLGFGLQNVINNFVSGIIILAERPIVLGDRVEVGGIAGQVRKINLRSTVVVTNDNISIIVPNSEFISKTVTNWSHGDPKVRVRIPFGVAYGTDAEKLKRVIMELAAANPHVLQEPAPSLFFESFGDSALNFELGVWTLDMLRSPRRFRSDLNFAIEKALRENGIAIPFPQRDLHLRSGSLVAPAAEKVPATDE